MISHSLWLRAQAVLLLVTFTGCASSTVIHSVPSGARLYLNGEPVGHTPYTMNDTKIVGSTTTVRLEKQGYEPTFGSIQRNEEFEVGACIGGALVLVPFLWIMGYKPTHSFEMRPLAAWNQPMPGPPVPYQPPVPSQPMPAQQVPAPAPQQAPAPQPSPPSR